MRTAKKLRPQVENLESMALLSGMGTAVQAHAVVQNPPAPILPAPLTGTINGTYVARQRNAPSRVDVSFFGTGRVAPIGGAALNGLVHMTDPLGGLVTDLGGNTLRLRGRRGSLTLQVTNVMGAADGSPGHFTFTYFVSAASGAYQSEFGESGTIDASLRSSIPRFVRPSGFDVGRFTMTFSTTATI